MTRLSTVPSLRPLLLILIGILAAALITSCRKDESLFGITGSGIAVTESRSPGIFTGVSLSIDADVILHVDSVYHVEVTAQPNILSVLQTNIRGGELCIGFRENVHSHSNITIHVYAPSYQSATISGSGSISNADAFSTTDFRATISGSGGVTMGNMTAASVNASISGSGDIALSGQAAAVRYTISGSGNIRGFLLTAQTGDVNISGSGNVEVNASQTLDIRISGSGNVYYKNTPAINASTSGSGKIIHVN